MRQFIGDAGNFQLHLFKGISFRLQQKAGLFLILFFGTVTLYAIIITALAWVHFSTLSGDACR